MFSFIVIQIHIGMYQVSYIDAARTNRRMCENDSDDFYNSNSGNWFCNAIKPLSNQQVRSSCKFAKLYITLLEHLS